MSELLLHNIIQHAYNTVPYYKQIYDNVGIDPEKIKNTDDLRLLPVITKDIIQKSPGKFISRDYLSYPNCEHLNVQRTSGSTGRVVKVYWTIEDTIRSLFYLWNIRKKYYGIDPESRFICFHLSTEDNSEQQDIKLINNNRSLSLNKLELSETKLETYYQHILDFKPQWFFVQPSICFILARFIRENNLEIPPSLKYIELTGEYLFEHYLKEIKKTFKVPVSNMYGSMETNGVAITCQHGRMHCLSKNVLVEILKNGQPVPPGEEGEIYLTSLTNYAMPFIRYEIGDIGSMLSGDTCPCGNKYPVLKIKAGRTSDYITAKDKSPINAFIFSRAIDNINLRYSNPILQFQVIQEAYEDFTVWLVIKDKFNIIKDDISQRFILEISMLGLNNLNWNIRFADEILPSTETGKLKFFANNISNYNDRALIM